MCIDKGEDHTHFLDHCQIHLPLLATAKRGNCDFLRMVKNPTSVGKIQIMLCKIDLPLLLVPNDHRFDCSYNLLAEQALFSNRIKAQNRISLLERSITAKLVAGVSWVEFLKVFGYYDGSRR